MAIIGRRAFKVDREEVVYLPQYRGLHTCVCRATCRTRADGIYKKHRRRTIDEVIRGFMGLDARAESTAIGFAEAGRAAPWFMGTLGARSAELTKALGKPGQAR
jgi:hypothetical protein